MKELMNISSALAANPLFKELQDSTDKIAGGGGYKRISLRGGKFRQIVDGEEINRRSDDLHIVIVDSAPISRTYYEGTYSADSSEPPTCWSSDSKVPDAKVPEEDRQASKCADCPMAIKGSGQGQTAACRFSQRLAVTLEGELDTVYQLSLPSKSLFGSAENGHMPLQAYGKMLKGHKIPAACVVTKMYFDEDSDTPKVFFKPARALAEDELNAVVELRNSDEVKDLLAISVVEADNKKPVVEEEKEEEQPKTRRKPAAKKPEPEEEEEDDFEADEPVETKPKTRRKPAAKKPEPEEEDEEPIEEPTKVSRKKAAEKPKEDIDDELAGLIDEWDD